MAAAVFSLLSGCKSTENLEVQHAEIRGECSFTLSTDFGCKVGGGITFGQGGGGNAAGGGNSGDNNGQTDEQVKEEIRQFIQDMSDVIYIQNGQNVVVEGIEVTLLDDNFVVATEVFEAVRNGATVKAADPEEIADWVFTKQFTDVQYETKIRFEPLDPHEPIVLTKTTIFDGLVLDSQMETIDPLCNFELQGVPACERRMNDI